MIDGNRPEGGLRSVIEQAKKEGKITREIALGGVAELGLLREAQRELGIKGR
jgi:hypothetical protein